MNWNRQKTTESLVFHSFDLSRWQQANRIPTRWHLNPRRVARQKYTFIINPREDYAKLQAPPQAVTTFVSTPCFKYRREQKVVFSLTWTILHALLPRLLGWALPTIFIHPPTYAKDLPSLAWAPHTSSSPAQKQNPNFLLLLYSLIQRAGLVCTSLNHNLRCLLGTPLYPGKHRVLEVLNQV